METLTIPTGETRYAAARRRTFELLEPSRDADRASRAVDLAILGLIGLNIVALVLESVAALSLRYGAFFRAFEAASVAVFTVEYLLRIWSATAQPGRGHWLRGRARMAGRPLVVIDALRTLPHNVHGPVGGTLFPLDYAVAPCYHPCRSNGSTYL